MSQLTHSEDYRVREARALADYHAILADLFAAMAKAGCKSDPRHMRIAAGQLQEDYHDVTGWAVAHPDVDCAKRAAAWLRTRLVADGRKARRFSFAAGRGQSELPAPVQCRRGVDLLDREGIATDGLTVFWLETGIYSIGD